MRGLLVCPHLFPCKEWETEMVKKAKSKGLFREPVSTIWEREQLCVADSIYPPLDGATLGFVACKALGTSGAMLCGDHRNPQPH